MANINKLAEMKKLVAGALTASDPASKPATSRWRSTRGRSQRGSCRSSGATTELTSPYSYACRLKFPRRICRGGPPWPPQSPVATVAPSDYNSRTPKC
jgi:hypothetical protein